MPQRYYNYENKCRRCGLLTNWHFSAVENISYNDFLVAINDKIKCPRAHWCNNCKKQTVQDVVSYSPHNGDE